jgi:hypothetical protein
MRRWPLLIFLFVLPLAASAQSIGLGYLHQFDYRINDETGRDFFQLSAQWEWARRRGR